MAKTYLLQRGGESIKIAKEPEHFTAILPERMLLKDVHKISEVEKVKQVFRTVYKIKTSESNRDGIMDKLRKDLKTKAVIHHAYNPIGDEATRYYITDTIIVRLAPGTKARDIDDLLQLHGLQFVKNYPGLPRTYLFKVTSSAGKNPVKVSLDLINNPKVEMAEPNLINRFAKAYTPTDTLFKKQWHLKSRTDIELVKGADVDAPAAWNITRGRRKVVVAVIDDGFDLNHPDLRGNGKKIVHPKDFVDGDSFPFPRAANNDYHGTPCAGVAIGEENGSGIVGVAPGCGFLPIRFDLAADDNTLYEIFDYAGQHADVISCSWGPVPVYAPLHSLLHKKFSELAKKGGPRKKGCVIVFAAGNFNAPLNDPLNKGFKWRHPGTGITKNTPGPIVNGNCTHPDVVAVSASTSQNRKAAYSNWGKDVCVAAPSNNWHPLDPSAKVPGRSIWTTDNETFGLDFTASSRYTGSFGGTSSATPLVAGIAALMISANPKITAKEVKKILKETADKIEDAKKDSILKHNKGKYKRGRCDWFGYGKVNAAQAVKAAKALGTPIVDPPPVDVQPAPTSPKALSEGLYIIAALANVKGRESGNERVSILNTTNQQIDLKGWSIENKSGRRHKIGKSTSLAAGEVYNHRLSRSVSLSNRGDRIRLINPDGVQVHEAVYKAADAKKEGWTIRF